MKTIQSFLIACVLFGCFAAKPALQSENLLITQYLIKKVFLSTKDSGAIVLIPLPTQDIQGYSQDYYNLKLWEVARKHFPGTTNAQLLQMIENSAWIDTTVRFQNHTLYFPGKPTQNADLSSIYELYKFKPVYKISNPLIAKDGRSCLVYVTGYQAGLYTVEMLKDEKGNWSSHKIYTDLLE